MQPGYLTGLPPPPPMILSGPQLQVEVDERKPAAAPEVQVEAAATSSSALPTPRQLLKIEGEGTVDDVGPPDDYVEEEAPRDKRSKARATAFHHEGIAFRKGHELATKQEYRCCGAEKNNCLRKIFHHNNGLITTNEMPHSTQCYIDNGLQEAGTNDVPTDGELPNVNSELEELVDQMAECCPKRMPAKDIARMAHVAMNDKYKNGWKGYKIKWLTDRVRRTRKKDVIGFLVIK